jgi:hypothetical protein
MVVDLHPAARIEQDSAPGVVEPVEVHVDRRGRVARRIRRDVRGREVAEREGGVVGRESLLFGTVNNRTLNAYGL